jgi:ABC-type nickel/cobalt efflux system permease component RcnA
VTKLPPIQILDFLIGALLALSVCHLKLKIQRRNFSTVKHHTFYGALMAHDHDHDHDHDHSELSEIELRVRRWKRF